MSNQTRQQDVTRKVVVPLKEVQDRIPRTESGDPAFTELGIVVPSGNALFAPKAGSLLDVFTKEQIVAIVNRWLYQAEYQQVSHTKRSQEIRDREKPVKEAFKELFPGVAFIKATEEQITEAIVLAAKRKVEGKQ